MLNPLTGSLIGLSVVSTVYMAQYSDTVQARFPATIQQGLAVTGVVISLVSAAAAIWAV